MLVTLTLSSMHRVIKYLCGSVDLRCCIRAEGLLLHPQVPHCQVVKYHNVFREETTGF